MFLSFHYGKTVAYFSNFPRKKIPVTHTHTHTHTNTLTQTDTRACNKLIHQGSACEDDHGKRTL